MVTIEEGDLPQALPSVHAGITDANLDGQNATLTESPSAPMEVETGSDSNALASDPLADIMAQIDDETNLGGTTSESEIELLQDPEGDTSLTEFEIVIRHRRSTGRFDETRQRGRPAVLNLE